MRRSQSPPHPSGPIPAPGIDVVHDPPRGHFSRGRRVRWNYALVFTPVWMATRIGTPAAPPGETHVAMQSRSRADETTLCARPVFGTRSPLFAGAMVSDAA